MTADRVSLTGGYEEAFQSEKAIANEGESLSGIAKKQHGSTEALQGSNHGGFATQMANGSTGVANTHEAQGLLDTSNASDGSRYLSETAGHEEEGAQVMSTESRTVDQGAQDLIGRINKA